MRSDRIAAAQDAGVNPALFGFNIGDLLKKGISIANRLANG